MSPPCRQYTPEFISQFVDGELDLEKTEAVSSHVTHCRACADQVASLQKLARVFNDHTTRQMALVKMAHIPGAARPGFGVAPMGSLGPLFRGMTDHWTLKLASLAAMAIFLILAVSQDPSQMGPSAIVKSLDTTASSVMIIETPIEKHTIIWFSET